MTNQPSQLPPLKLSIEEDASSFSRIEQRTAQTFDRINSLAKANDAVGQSAQRMGSALSAAFQSGVTKVDANTKAIQALRKEVQGLGEDQDKVSAGGGLRVEGLRRTGGALSQLGLGEIGGAVSRAGDVAQVNKELGNLMQSLGPLAPILAGVAGAAIGLQIGLAILERQFKDDKQALQSALDTQKDYYQLVASATTEDVERRKSDLEKTAAIQKQALGETENALKSLEQQTNISREVGEKLPGILGDPFRMLLKQLDDNKKAVGDTEAAIGRLEGGLKSNAFAANDATKAVEDYVAALDEGRAKQVEFARTDQAATQKSLDTRLKAIQIERSTITDELAQLQKQDQTNAAVIDKEKQLEKALADLATEEAHLTTVTRTLVNARASERANTRTDSPQLKELIASEDRQIAVIQRYNAERERIEQQSAEQRANIEKKYADKLIDIARAAADGAEEALRKLEERREELATTFVHDEEKAARDVAAAQLDAQINAARDEAKAYRDHQRELEQIRKDAAARETGMLLDRNFKALYESRLQTSRDIERANENFTAERQERQIALRAQLDDLKRAAAREHAERLIAYQQALADARTAYRRDLAEVQRKHDQELQMARQAHQRELADLRTATQNKLTLLRNATIREIAEAKIVGEARIKLLEKERQYLLSQIGSFGGGNGNQEAHHAGGGAMAAGDISWVNERRGQRERFNGVPLPPGLGLFMAARGGSVSPGGGGAVTLNVYPSPGMDEEQFAHKVIDLLEKVIA